MRAKGAPEDIDRVLAENPRLLGRLLNTYIGYLFRGEPRQHSYSPPPPEYHPPLSMLTNFNERFILAHEYSHTLFDSLGFDAPNDLPKHQEELQADLLAFRLVAESGHTLDQVPPNISLQGAFFVLAVLETLRRGVDIARHGEVQEDLGFATHPPVALRRQFLVDAYREEVSDDDDGYLSIRGALTPSRSLIHLWQKLEGPLRKHAELRLPLHPMWP